MDKKIGQGKETEKDFLKKMQIHTKNY